MTLSSGKLVDSRCCVKHVNVKSIEQTLSLLNEHKGEAKVIAGGTDLLRLMKNRVVLPRVLVNVKTIPGMAYIKEDADGLLIGPLTTIKDIETSPVINSKYKLLAEAAHSVASPHIRNMATIVGNLCQEFQCWYYRRSPVTGRSFLCRKKGGKVCYAVAGENAYHAIIGGEKCFAVCSSDMATALMTLGATLNVTGFDGDKMVPLDTFYSSLGNILGPDEIIREIRIPTVAPDTTQCYLKFSFRKAIDFAISSVAVVITTGARRVVNTRISLGGVAPVPYRALRAEDTLKGEVITEGLAETAAEAAVSDAKPLSRNAYKIPITKELIKRAILYGRTNV